MLGDVDYGWLIIFSEQGYEIKAKEKIFWHEICVLYYNIPFWILAGRNCLITIQAFQQTKRNKKCN